jgi:hypothetical protein
MLVKRIFLFSIALSVSAVLAEVAYRLIRPAPYTKSQMVKSDGSKIPTSEIANFLRTSNTGSVAIHPRGTLKPGLEFKQFYDRPTQPYFDEDGQIPVKINELGFRDLPFTLDKKPGEYRILTVGDSFTFGSGVLGKDTWPQQLEILLKAARNSPVEVINGGFAAGSHHVAGYEDWIRSDGLDFKPDVLMIGLCLNDIGPIQMLGYPVLTPETAPDESPWLGGISEILNTIQGAMLMSRVKQEKLDGTLVLKYFPEPWKDAKKALHSIKQVCDERNTRLIVAVFPMITQLNENYPLDGVHNIVAEFMAKAGIETVDLLHLFMGREESDLWVHPTDQHPNHIGQGLIAGGIFEYLKANPKKPKPR